MGTVRDTLETIVRLDGADNYIGAMRAMGDATGNAADKQRQMAETFGKLSMGSAAVAGAGVAVAGWAIKQTNAFDVYRNKLEIALKSKTKADRAFAGAVTYANITPFSTGEVVDATARLEMYGLSAAKWLPMIGDMSAAMGKSMTDGVEAVADAISGGGLERLKEFGIGSMQLKGAGWTGSYQDAAGMESLKKAMQDIMSSRYAGGTAKLFETLSGRFSTFTGEVETLAASIGEALKPQLFSIIDNATKMAQALGKTTPETKAFIAEAIKVTVVAGAVGALYFKFQQVRLSMAANAAMAAMSSAQNVAANAQETVAVRGATVAYNEKAEAYARAYAAGDRAAMQALYTGKAQAAGAARGSWASMRFGGAGGWMGQAQTVIGMTGATMAMGDALASSDWEGKVMGAGKAIGYVAGMFNPFILGATLMGDAIARLVDSITTGRQRVANETMERIPGSGGSTGAPLTDKEMADLYDKQRRYAKESRSFEDFRDAERRAERDYARRKAAAQAAADAKKIMEGTVSLSDYEAEGAALSSQRSKLMLEGARRKAETPEGYVRNAESIGTLSDRYQQNLEDEAKALHKKAAALYAASMMAKDDEERRKLTLEAGKANIDSLEKEAAAAQVGAEKQKELEEARKKAAEAITEELHSQLEGRISLSEAMYGPDSQQTKAAHDSMARFLTIQALSAEAAGRQGEALKLAADAVREYKEAHDDLLTSLKKGLEVSDAYADYLDAIGAKDAANAYRRTTQARQQADLAAQLKEKGDMAGYYHAMASAERLARAGEEDKGAGRISGMKGTSRAGEALMGYVPAIPAGGTGSDVTAAATRAEYAGKAGRLEAAGRQGTTVVNPLVTVHVYDDEGNAKQRRVKRADYFGSFSK